jgi:hypothetical protein
LKPWRSSPYFRRKRIGEIEDLAKAAAGAGSSLVLAADSVAIAEHTVGLGLPSLESISEVRNERMATVQIEPEPQTYSVQRPTPTKTAKAVEQGDLQHLIEVGSEPMPPNVIVEPTNREHPKAP